MSYLENKAHDMTRHIRLLKVDETQVVIQHKNVTSMS